MIHTTRGVYPDGSSKVNGVPSEDLAAHIEYNLACRPGRAFFLDGVCIYKGIGVRPETIEKFRGKDPIGTMKRDTQPYV